MSKEITSVELQEPIWERQVGESTTWYRRFCKYRNQIGTRSILAAVRLESEEKSSGKRFPKSVPGSWEDARVKFRWQERCEAWDLRQQEKEDQIWEERLNTLREKGWELSELMLEKATTMLQMPIVAHTLSGSNGKQTVIQATDWPMFRIPIEMAKAALEIGYKSIGDPNRAVQLLTKLGFEVRDPSASKDPMVALEALETGDLGTLADLGFNVDTSHHQQEQN